MSNSATRWRIFTVRGTRAVLFLFILLASAAAPKPVAAQAGQSQTGSAQPGELKPTYPGEPFNNPPVETTIGPAKLRLYGTALLNMSFSDTAQVGQDVPLWPLPSTANVTLPDGTTKPAGQVHDTIFTARQSILGVVLNPANFSTSGWMPSAQVEIDFFGTRPIDTNLPQNRVLNQPRLRLAFFQLQKGDFKLVAGQDKIIISPLDPVSLSHVAVPLGYSAGDLFGWLPQVRVDYNHKFGDTGTLFQFGVLRPAFGDPRLGDEPAASVALDTTSSGFGERASQPFYQARFAVSHPMSGSTATIGAGAHYGSELVGFVGSTNHKVDSWAFTLDFRVPIVPKLILRGEGFVGSNLVPFGGGAIQGVAAVGTAPNLTLIRPIGDGGGWAELTFLATRRNVFYIGASTDDPKNRELLPGTTRQKNSFVWASYFRKITDSVTLAAEWSNWQFHTIGFVGNTPAARGAFGRGNVINIAFAYQF
ncbi:MAG: hypothetical protein DMG31_12425 [Acidobacteria bacterium]|nr:MAG: hypothetical protein DMG31_12425 [Acidobacteriota bacterium]